MKILSASQLREADAYAIAHEPVASSELMERAAMACFNWISRNINPQHSFKIFCGPGNNGGDGLAIARLLIEAGKNAEVFIIKAEKYSDDFLLNEKRLKKISPDSVHSIRTENDLPAIAGDDCVIDALFGTGLSKPLAGFYEKIITHINNSGAEIISIDMPSGLYSDGLSSGPIVQAHATLTFQTPKLSLLFPGNFVYAGECYVLDIGLDQKYIQTIPSASYFVTGEDILPLLQKRKKFSHKGNYGHALLVAGGKGKIGAAVLAAKGCLRTGAGLLSVYVPESGREIIQITSPEAMIAINIKDLEKYSAIGIGPGMGTGKEAVNLLKSVLQSAKNPLVIDADALNIISSGKKWLKMIPPDSILTPHPKEFERLAGKSKNDFDRHARQMIFSKKHKVIVVLKGANSCITTPAGFSYFNSTGNPGMAKGGSGDILTGMITSLLAQGYSAEHAAVIGVYLHGLAGDIAAKENGMDGMIAGDVVEAIPRAWRVLRG